jgi:hypothetical protein
VGSSLEGRLARRQRQRRRRLLGEVT